MYNIAEPPELLRDAAVFTASVQSADNRLLLCKTYIAELTAWLDEGFRASAPIRELVNARADYIDRLLIAIWQCMTSNPGQALIAVGGYGRGELHPHSDIDLLILLPQTPTTAEREELEAFVTFLWDLSLDIGHSVRTVDECLAVAAEDLTVATNLLESRVLCGDAAIYDNLLAKTRSEDIWPTEEFFRAKWDELFERHAKYGHTEYRLEPNVKTSPGGLRDLQTIGWVMKRHFNAGTFQELQDRGVLQQEELDQLRTGQEYLWRVRYALHMLNGREEDRLLFDHQRALAELFGFYDTDASLAIEQFMREYFRCVMGLGELRDVILQHFDETIMKAAEPESVVKLNRRFQIRNGSIEVTSDTVFEKSPGAIMELFVLAAQNEDITDVRASTIRLIRRSTHLIDDKFRRNRRNRAHFMDLLRSNKRVALYLRLMRRFGVLGAYLPEFGRIIGQMQHDLFHIYTVDAHTLELIKNLRRFFYDEYRERYPVASRVIRRIEQPELLYVAGLYHDIAKGRGGDHSKLGVVDARAFCKRHGLSRVESNLVCWMVEHHLLMSSISQRQDLSDPDVIADFAGLVGDQRHLDYLYVLTVADINATNPTLWTSWRASLMRQLYAETTRALSRGLENPVDRKERIKETKKLARAQLVEQGFVDPEIDEIWDLNSEDYFLRERVEDIVWHSCAISEHRDPNKPLVLIRQNSSAGQEAASAILVHFRDENWLFAVLASAMEQLDLNIQDAHIYTSAKGHALITFHVLNSNNQPLDHEFDRVEHLRKTLIEHIQDPDNYTALISRRTPRQIRMFSYPTRTRMATDMNKGYTWLEVISPDRPGLLARIGGIFYEYGVVLQNAKISTLGERVEDVFFITDQDNRPIQDSDLCEAIARTIREELDEQTPTQERVLEI